MRLEEAREMVLQHNQSILEFKKKLTQRYGEQCPIRLWFEIQTEIEDQHFYEKGRALGAILRSCGFICKMNMQTYEMIVEDPEPKGEQ